MEGNGFWGPLELAVTLYELAFHLNIRPLTSSDEEPLTPAHLLSGVTSIRGVIAALVPTLIA